MKYQALAIIFVFLALATCGKEKPQKNAFREMFTKEQSVEENKDGEWRVVKQVVDGDTLVLYKDEKVRLIGVDTPETVHPKRPVEYFGKEASNFTRQLAEGKKVWLEYDQERTDKYGRTLAYVHFEDGRVLNEEIIRLGYGHVYTWFPFKYMEKYRALEREARDSKAGLWAEKPAIKKKPILVAQTKQSVIVYITDTGKKYHSSGCRFLKDSCIPVSIEDAKVRGYEPCGVCNPPK